MATQIPSVEQRITPFSVTLVVDSGTFPEDVDIYNSEYPSVVLQTNILGKEFNAAGVAMNVLSGEINVISSKTDGYMTKTLGYRNETQQFRDEVMGYVIPTEATLSPEAINALLDTHRLENFLGFKF